MRFFIRSYLGRTEATSRPAQAELVTKSSYDAVKGVEREILKAMSRDRGSAYNSTSSSDTDTVSIRITPALKEQLKDAKAKLNEEAKWLSTKTSNETGKGYALTKDSATKAIDKSKDVVESITSTSFEEVKAKAEETAALMKDRIKEATGRSKEAAANVKNEAADTVPETEQKEEEVVGTPSDTDNKVDNKTEENANKQTLDSTPERSKSPSKNATKRTESPSKKSTSRSQSPTKKVSKIPTKARDKSDSAKPPKSAEKSKDASGSLLSRIDSKVKATAKKYRSRSKTPEPSGEEAKGGAEDSKKPPPVQDLLSNADSRAEDLVREAYAAAEQAEKGARDEGDSLSSISMKEDKASSYEANIDDVTSAKEKDAEKEMQPAAVATATDGAADKGDDEAGAGKEGEEEGTEGGMNESRDLAASYEANFDEVMSGAQKEAEREMQPEGVVEF